MTPAVDPHPGSPWHAGELAMQQSAGAAERMRGIGSRFIRDHLPAQHQAFYPLLHHVALGAVDGHGDAWATIRAGRPGFLHSPDPRTLHLALGREADDPAEAGLDDGMAVGLLGLDMRTRRRNRLNGWVRRPAHPGGGGAGFAIDVEHSFGNCPRYIALRDVAFTRAPGTPSGRPAQWLDGLDDAARRAIAAADTLFVASYVDDADGGRHVDVSHRGGRPGFVHVDADGTLTVPDFNGNLFFNTLGNLLANPKAGVSFVDFSTGDLLQVTGDAEVILDAPGIAAFDGAERLWRLHPRRAARRPGALPLRWQGVADGASPHSLATGTWEEAAARLGR